MNFELAYSREEAVVFLQNDFLPDDFQPADESLSVPDAADNISQIKRLGYVSSLRLAVYELTHKSEGDPRVSISKTLFRLMAENGNEQALAFVRSINSKNWRMSLATLTLDPEGRRVKKEYSNPKRFSFYLGPGAKVHTPSAVLKKRGRVESLGDLKDRFSIEVVNKNFYDGIAKLFTELTGGDREEGNKTRHHAGLLKLPSETQGSLKSKEFAVRLIGRLVFCWFLKKKGSQRGGALIPDALLSLASAKIQADYYHTVLEPLFFEVLNKELAERESEFRKDPWSLVPFLNGGLFDPHNDDFYERGPMGDSKYRNILKVPDDWLTKLLELFETFNFTIDENTPVDVELSVDPEMLGRIFENLLAEINPETGESARKASGSYYTPRSVVDYMVEESLKLYIQSKTGLSSEKIQSLFSYATEPISLTKSEKAKLIQALEEVRMIDPACGSGAFPMGILQRIFLLLQYLDPDKSLWLDNMLVGVPDNLVREEMRKRLQGETSQYLYKLKLIRDCIFGVDIQPVAVEIAKLRCFLSLIVDEKVEDKKSNRGIEPLPNLEFKFVCANTLIDLPKTEQKSDVQLLPGMGEDMESINQLRAIRTQFFNSHGKKKRRLEEDFKKVQDKMFDFHLKQITGRSTKVSWDPTNTQKGNKSSETQTGALATWNPFKREACPWFDPEWMFGFADGFDIAIANPPYVRQEDIDTDLKKRLAPQKLPKLKGESQQVFAPYECYTGLSDLYVFFYERSIKLLKEGGVLAFISSNKYFRSGYGGKLRAYLSQGTTLKQIIDFGDAPVFTAIAYPSIIVLIKTRPNGNGTHALNWEMGPPIDDFKEVFNKQSFLIAQKALTADGWRLESPSVLKLLEKIRAAGQPLDEYVKGRFYRGILTGLNEAFIVDRATRDRLVKEHKSSAEILKPFLRGRDVKRWRVEFADRYLIKIESSENILHPWSGLPLKAAESTFEKTYPAISAYLRPFRQNLIDRDDQGHYYWELRSCAYWKEFEQQKIAWGNLATEPQFSFASPGYHINAPACLLVSESKYLLGILNSRIAHYLVAQSAASRQGGFVEFKPMYISPLPIPDTPTPDQEKISRLVDKITSMKKDDSGVDVSPMENEINQHVFKLYGLNKEEMKIIESETLQ